MRQQCAMDTPADDEDETITSIGDVLRHPRRKIVALQLI